MPKNKPVPESLLSRLHGKGTMSEILDIERTRLLKQSEEDMRRRLGSGTERSDAKPLEDIPTLPVVGTLPEPSAGSVPQETAKFQLQASVAVPFDAQHAKASAAPITPSPVYPAISPSYSGFAGSSPIPQELEIGPERREGLSKLSRLVGEDLSELGVIFRHSAATVLSESRFSPQPCQDHYSQSVEPALPFTAQRNLLRAIRRLTLGWGVLSCQITLELLSAASGIRNIKTLRKWIADLHQRRIIRYTPIHGDLRGSIITLTPPPEIRATIDRWWKEAVEAKGRPAEPKFPTREEDAHQ